MWLFLDEESVKQGPLTDAELRALVAEGVISMDTLVCKQGAEGWLPLRKTALAAAMGIPGEGPALWNGREMCADEPHEVMEEKPFTEADLEVAKRVYRPLQWRTRLLSALLLVTIFAFILTMSALRGLTNYNISLEKNWDWESNVLAWEAVLVDDKLRAAKWVMGLTLPLSFIYFLMWVYRAHRNLFALTLQEKRYSPGLGVFWFCVPFVNLYNGYRLLSEVERLSRSRWSGDGKGWLVSLWLFFAGTLLLDTFVYAGPVYAPTTPMKVLFDDKISEAAKFERMLLLFYIVCTCLQVGFIRRVAEMQELKADRLGIAKATKPRILSLSSLFSKLEAKVVPPSRRKSEL